MPLPCSACEPLLLEDFMSELKRRVTELTARAPFVDGVRRQVNTRGTVGSFFQDGVRTAPGGSSNAEELGWHPGMPEVYHSSKQPKEQQQEWRAARKPLLSLLYSYLQQSIGPGLMTYQTAVAQQPGLNEQQLRLQPDVPYQQMQSSLNAAVGCHIDSNDFLGTTIAWLALPGKAGAMLGAAFVMYDLGLVVNVGHLAHVWVRSDRCWHGTVRDGGAQHAIDSGAVLFGTALANNQCVTRAVLEVFNKGGLKTWLQQYDGEQTVDVMVKPAKQ